MMRSNRHFDWRRLAAADAPGPFDANRGNRSRWILAAIAVGAAVIFARIVALECFYGAAYRREAAQPIRRVERIPGPRGRILARDGTVLAYDRQIAALAVHYRYLEEPPTPRWLEQQARRRLPRSQRSLRPRVEAQRQRLLSERADLRRRLARLCGQTPEDFAARAAQIQARVSRIAAHVNERRRVRHAAEQARLTAEQAPDDPEAGWPRRLLRWLAKIIVVPETPTPFSTIAVAEEVDYHVVFEGLPLDVVAEIEAHPDRYPGVRIVERRRRTYPSGPLASHVLGHLAPLAADDLASDEDVESANDETGDAAQEPYAYAPEDLVGRLGIERRFESALRGQAGLVVERSNRSGQVLSSERKREPLAGRDLVLSIDPALQGLAETLLDQTLARRMHRADGEQDAAGGAVAAMDVRTGALLVAASAPRFDPNAFAARDQAELKRLLERRDHPLFDRVTRMGIAPGSVFKALSAVALLESNAVYPEQTFYCRGYLHEPTRQRCMIYRRQQRGHESISLVDALAQSCNVYFFHFAEQAGPEPLIAWAEKFGFGSRTGVDLPDESPGTLPKPGSVREQFGHPWRDGDTLALAIGQGDLTATPLQILRLMAAIANGGRLVKPRVALRFAMTASATEAEGFDDGAAAASVVHSEPIVDLSPATLAAVRRGLERVVADPNGTGHGAVYCDTIAIAGKTGTAETGGGREDHAWFAGYAPAEAPTVAFVVALEHAGSGSDAAGPIAKRLVQKMQALGYFRRTRATKP